MPLILRATSDGVGSETHTAEYLPSGIAINSHHIIFLEAIAASGDYPHAPASPAGVGFPPAAMVPGSASVSRNDSEKSEPRTFASAGTDAASSHREERHHWSSGASQVLETRVGTCSVEPDRTVNRAGSRCSFPPLAPRTGPPGMETINSMVEALERDDARASQPLSEGTAPGRAGSGSLPRFREPQRTEAADRGDADWFMIGTPRKGAAPPEEDGTSEWIHM